MTNHHPSPELLLDYAAGSLPEAVSLAVATHLALCPDCRRTVSEAEALGGGLLAEAEAAPLDDDVLVRTMARLDVSGAAVAVCRCASRFAALAAGRPVRQGRPYRRCRP